MAFIHFQQEAAASTVAASFPTPTFNQLHFARHEQSLSLPPSLVIQPKAGLSLGYKYSYWELLYGLDERLFDESVAKCLA